MTGLVGQIVYTDAPCRKAFRNPKSERYRNTGVCSTAIERPLCRTARARLVLSEHRSFVLLIRPMRAGKGLVMRSSVSTIKNRGITPRMPSVPYPPGEASYWLRSLVWGRRGPRINRKCRLVKRKWQGEWQRRTARPGSRNEGKRGVQYRKSIGLLRSLESRSAYRSLSPSPHAIEFSWLRPSLPCCTGPS